MVNFSFFRVTLFRLFRDDELSQGVVLWRRFVDCPNHKFANRFSHIII